MLIQLLIAHNHISIKMSLAIQRKIKLLKAVFNDENYDTFY